ncbi:hypothetical protein O181_089034 [Austropuccinia psidii MF-1]|uniref:Uncharacterized protein n=1 Tax=Austropuccinia psidii MF-1 TaxID=1389203 RepID=A0A9Q3P4R5_9BASI|nr:hypothetical protein [Austropuccinia psidii MF-1]
MASSTHSSIDLSKILKEFMSIKSSLSKFDSNSNLIQSKLLKYPQIDLTKILESAWKIQRYESLIDRINRAIDRHGDLDKKLIDSKIYHLQKSRRRIHLAFLTINWIKLACLFAFQSLLCSNQINQNLYHSTKLILHHFFGLSSSDYHLTTSSPFLSRLLITPTGSDNFINLANSLNQIWKSILTHLLNHSKENFNLLPNSNQEFPMFSNQINQLKNFLNIKQLDSNILETLLDCTNSLILKTLHWVSHAENNASALFNKLTKSSNPSSNLNLNNLSEKSIPSVQSNHSLDSSINHSQTTSSKLENLHPNSSSPSNNPSTNLVTSKNPNQLLPPQSYLKLLPPNSFSPLDNSSQNQLNSIQSNSINQSQNILQPSSQYHNHSEPSFTYIPTQQSSHSDSPFSSFSENIPIPNTTNQTTSQTSPTSIQINLTAPNPIDQSSSQNDHYSLIQPDHQSHHKSNLAPLSKQNPHSNPISVSSQIPKLTTESFETNYHVPSKPLRYSLELPKTQLNSNSQTSKKRRQTSDGIVNLSNKRRRPNISYRKLADELLNEFRASPRLSVAYHQAKNKILNDYDFNSLKSPVDQRLNYDQNSNPPSPLLL